MTIEFERRVWWRVEALMRVRLSAGYWTRRAVRAGVLP
jgi:hypothetical protein